MYICDLATSGVHPLRMAPTQFFFNTQPLHTGLLCIFNHPLVAKCFKVNLLASVRLPSFKLVNPFAKKEIDQCYHALWILM